ncbi:uncharacterized protein LOC111687426 isoform X2 [Lucilia cuprina]|uniref:uncharacterized protein LOC111687426 isoform X2 n=1 Tax=Lucilia cuprina TaxID=7375 RepID=UPI001F065CDB|nr:uncharacterized protein LOC111687426 isoform X2 [Lucilia cuprina]
MPTKQELMDMMDNRLPGETLPLSDSAYREPPAYPDLERVSYASQQHREYHQQQQQFLPQQVYTIRQPEAIIQPTQFGTRSHLAYCPSCHATQMTRCEYQSGMMTHIIATILCFTTYVFYSFYWKFYVLYFHPLDAAVVCHTFLIIARVLAITVAIVAVIWGLIQNKCNKILQIYTFKFYLLLKIIQIYFFSYYSKCFNCCHLELLFCSLH